MTIDFWNWNIEAATKTGPHHYARNEGNQDCFAIKRNKDYIIAAVADGAGSLALSADGARIACTAAIFHGQGNLEKNLDIPLSEIVKMSIDAAINTLNSDHRRKLLGCTFAMAVITKKDFAVGTVGDCFAVIHMSDSHYFFQGESISEFANITELLTSNNPKINIFESEIEENFRGLTLSTDGLKPMSSKNNEAIQGFWEPIVKMMEDKRFKAADFLDYIEDRLIDDSTIAIIIES